MPQQDDLANVVLGPDDEPPNRRHKVTRQRVGRLPPLPGPHVRVPLQWICQPRQDKYLFRPSFRLFLYLLYRSYWGQRGVALTADVTAEIGLSRWAGYRALSLLEREKWVRVERRPGHALVVWPIVLST
jgi:hypothetical protein